MSPISPHEQGESLEYRELDASKEACPDLTERGEVECLPRLNQAIDIDIREIRDLITAGNATTQKQIYRLFAATEADTNAHRSNSIISGTL